MEETKIDISELFDLINTLTEEKNYIEVLKGYCENSLETSDDLNKIYPIINTIYNLHLEVWDKSRNLNTFKC